MKMSSSDATRSDLDDKTITLIESIAGQVRANIESGKLPDIKLPVRSLDNVTYDEAKGYFELGDARKVRSLTVSTARSFAQTLRLMATSRAMVEHDDFATKREVYYVSKNWGDCRFDEQAESDTIMDDIEAMASMQGLSREQLRFYPESHGGSVAGRLTVVDRNPATGEAIEIDCTNFGEWRLHHPALGRTSDFPHRRTSSYSRSKPAACFSASIITGSGRRHDASSSRWAGSRPAPHGASFACFPTNRTCRSTALSIATLTALPIFTARSRSAPAMRLT